MITRCKFRCSDVGQYQPSGAYTATFHPVYTGSEENKAFFASTPGGMLQLSVLREQRFEIGKEYYIDIIAADE